MDGEEDFLVDKGHLLCDIQRREGVYCILACALKYICVNIRFMFKDTCFKLQVELFVVSLASTWDPEMVCKY